MSRELPPDWAERKLAELRRQAASEEWSELAARLLADVKSVAAGSEDEAGNEEMLTIAVNDAFAGVDIQERHPHFFRQMLVTPQLYEMFLEGWELLEAERTGALDALPFEPSRDLSFLDRLVSPQPVVEQETAGRWRALWQATTGYLEALFAGLDADLALAPEFREAGVLEPSSLTLLQGNIQVNDMTLDVTLNAIQREDAPLELLLRLWVLESKKPQAVQPAQPLQATLSWGSYHKTVTFNRYGLVSFPAVPWPAIEGTKPGGVGAELRLRLEPAE